MARLTTAALISNHVYLFYALFTRTTNGPGTTTVQHRQIGSVIQDATNYEQAIGKFMLQVQQDASLEPWALHDFSCIELKDPPHELEKHSHSEQDGGLGA
jgi:hypothetical protein